MKCIYNLCNKYKCSLVCYLLSSPSSGDCRGKAMIFLLASSVPAQATRPVVGAGSDPAHSPLPLLDPQILPGGMQLRDANVTSKPQTWLRGAGVM